MEILNDGGNLYRKTGLKFSAAGTYRVGGGGGKRTSVVGGPNGPLGNLGFPKRSLVGRHILIDGNPYKVTGLVNAEGGAIPVEAPDAGVGGLVVLGALLLFTASQAHTITTTIEGIEVIACEDPIISGDAYALASTSKNPLLVKRQVALEFRSFPPWTAVFAAAALSDDFSTNIPFGDEDFTHGGDSRVTTAVLRVQFETTNSRSIHWSFSGVADSIYFGDNICPPPGRNIKPMPGLLTGRGAIFPGSAIIL